MYCFYSLVSIYGFCGQGNEYLDTLHLFNFNNVMIQTYLYIKRHCNCYMELYNCNTNILIISCNSN